MWSRYRWGTHRRNSKGEDSQCPPLVNSRGFTAGTPNFTYHQGIFANRGNCGWYNSLCPELRQIDVQNLQLRLQLPAEVIQCTGWSVPYLYQWPTSEHMWSRWRDLCQITQLWNPAYSKWPKAKPSAGYRCRRHPWYLESHKHAQSLSFLMCRTILSLNFCSEGNIWSAKCWVEKLAVEMSLLLVSVHHWAWLHLAKAFLYAMPTKEH